MNIYCKVTELGSSCVDINGWFLLGAGIFLIIAIGFIGSLWA